MSNCIALVSAGLAGVGTRLDMIVPVAHAAAEHKMITTPDADTPPWPPPSPDSRPTPASPIASPATGASPSLAWLSTASMPTSHSGTVAMSSAVSPDGTVVSADAHRGVGADEQDPHDRAAQPFRTPRPVRDLPARRRAPRRRRS